MNELPPSSVGKRAACDRCHALKMRCVVDQTDGSGSQRRCRRCHGARVACNYSVPGRSGRPPTKPGGQILTAQTGRSTNNTRTGLVSTPSSLFSSIQVAPSLASALDAQGFSFAQKTPVSPRSNSWTDTVALLHQESYAPSPWDSLPHQDAWMGGQSLAEHRYLENYNTTQSSMHPTRPLSAVVGTDSSPQTQASTGTLELSPDNRPRQASTTNSSVASPPEARYDGQQYLQRLSEFNVRLSHPVGLTPDAISSSRVSPDQLEHAATHILSSSTAFLELIGYPSSGMSPSPTPDMAARLQLLVSYMRLTELHYGLYTAVYGYLKHTLPTAGERAPDLGFSLAGVALSPSPRFQLQILLQTATQYLCAIQEALGLPAPLQLRGFRQLRSATSPEKANLLGQPGSAETAMLMHTLMMHDQESRLKGMMDMLERLKTEFGIVVMFG